MIQTRENSWAHAHSNRGKGKPSTTYFAQSPYSGTSYMENYKLMPILPETRWNHFA